MKRILLIMAMAIAFTATITARTTKGKAATVQTTGTLMVMSDIHTMAPSLVKKTGSAFDNYEKNDMRMIARSAEILDALVDKALKLRPAAVLIAGDLTKDGELESHQYVVSKLNQLQAQGIRVLVVPGNHDISNPNAKIFDGDKTLPAETIDRDMFTHLYADFGYASDSNYDPNSLSYVTEVLPGLVLIAIDSNRDEENLLKSRGDSIDSYHNGGRIKPETMQWIAEQATQARAQGKQVIAMMHHHAVQHVDREQSLLPNYIVANAEKVRDQLMEAGIHLLLTGHLHVNDIALNYNSAATDSIYEIATGSAITYPFAYRLLSPSKDLKKIGIKTEYITSTPSCKNLKEAGRKRLEHGANALATMAANRLWNRLDGKLGKVSGMLALFEAPIKLPQTAQELQAITMKYFDKPLQQVVMEFAEADESSRDNTHILNDFRTCFKGMIGDMLPDEGGYISNFLLEEFYPKLEPLLKSVIEDRNQCGTSHETVVRDLNTTLELR